MKRFGHVSLVLALLLGVFAPIQAFAAATLLPPGMNCFAAETASSGGTAGFITGFGSITGGSGYIPGTYANVPLTGGSGVGAIGVITVNAGGAVSNVVISNPGSHYVTTDVLSATNGNLGGSGAGFSIPVSSVQGSGTGMVGVLGTITGGSGGTTGTYPNVALTGGMGSNATANITVSGGAVTGVTVVNPGVAYQVGDVLSANGASIGGVSGFSIPVNSISINSSLAGGKVYFYIPNTQTPKSTWFNADQATSHQNTNPVLLDANGCAVIYGTGSYRQILQDSLGDTVWDQITTDTSANNNYFWAGLAGGTPNVITIIDPGFNATDGSQISFTAIATNTGAVTINPSGFGAIAVEKDTTAGPVSLTGGEIVQNNTINATYSAVANAFILTNPPIPSPAASTAPLCGVNGYIGVNDSSTPNTIFDMSAKSAVMVNAAGSAINRSNVSVTVNFGINGAGGLDAGSFTGSAVYYLYLIDNGAAPSALASASSTSPTLPNGYSYICRIGAIPSASGPILYQVSAGGNKTFFTQTLTSTPFVVSAVTGTCFSAFTAESFTLVPPTANFVFAQLGVLGAFAGGIGKAASGSNIYAGTTSVAGLADYKQTLVPFGPTQIVYYCSSRAAPDYLEIDGWIDSVNAN